MLDVLIVNAAVFDGSSNEPVNASVGIKEDMLAHVSTRSLGANAARETIDARGYFLCPGFIDTHASNGFGYFFDHAADHKIYQGVTTEIIGNCGTSPSPVGGMAVDQMRGLSERIGFPFGWRSTGEYFRAVEDAGIPINVGTYIGHSTLRSGFVPEGQPTSDDMLARMCQTVAQSMSEGSLGMSTGLVYPPGCFADTRELVELARVVSQHGGVYATHLRDERDLLEDAVQEALNIGKKADIPVVISHLKAAERPNWGKIPKVLDHISRYSIEHSLQVLIEVYPYEAVSTYMRTFLPKAILREGADALPSKLSQDDWIKRTDQWFTQRHIDFSTMYVISKGVPEFAGLSVKQIASKMGINNLNEAARELLVQDPHAWIVYHCISPEDVRAAIRWPDSVICSDSWSYPVNAPVQIGEPHPRTYAAFTKLLKQYVLEEGLLTFGQAVKKVTSLPAKFLKLGRRGLVREGFYADIILLDPAELEARATFENPRQLSKGLKFMWINGKEAFRKSEGIVNDKCGRLLKCGGA
jgi:N-acyl-D-amino-acid deacylase